MATAESLSACRTYRLGELFQISDIARSEPVVSSGLFSRSLASLPDGGTLLRDDFPDGKGACCLFVRLPQGASSGTRFVVDGTYHVASCVAGGWLLESRDEAAPSYWIPQPPVLRTTDAHGRILQEEAASLTGFDASTHELAVSVQALPGLSLDCVVWRIPEEARGLCSELKHLYNLETARTFLWSSQTAYGLPADLYLYLIDGRVYQNARAWPRKWKFCCELDAYEIFVWMSGLELATHKRLYGLLRRQILLSVIARQSADGGWYHGEWTDLYECHYRFHNGALLLLENALDEWDDNAIRTSLAKGATFIASRVDKTDLGLWFLHDSLEESAESMNEMYRQTGALVKNFGAWKPTYMLGKSSTNKMILNTHVDTTVTLDRYGQLCGDVQFRGHVESARRAIRNLLGLQPANLLNRIVYWAVRLTLLPASRAARLPLPIRAVKRLTWMYLVPNLYRLKFAFPRIVMPGGFIDRHLSPLHFDAKYHAVNVLDLVRLWRRFPDEQLDRIVNDAVHFVLGNDKSTLRWWAESKPRQFAVVVFAEALYHLCMLNPLAAYRKHLAEVLLFIEDLGFGLPPSLLGGDGEIARHAVQVGCPSPADQRLRVANLSTINRAELLVINPTIEVLQLTWETEPPARIAWEGADGAPAAGAPDRLQVPSHGWIIGRAPRSH